MKILDSIRFSLCYGAAALALSSCGGLLLPVGAPSVKQQSAELAGPSTSYHVVYAFGGDHDGVHPYAGLLNVNGTLYGTTIQGGADRCGAKGKSCGTVFSVTAAGKEHVLYRFNGSSGSFPRASLVDIKGILYGTTSGGGPHGDGTVFSVTTAGNEKVLHSFGGGSDGMGPVANLLDVDGTLYGTTTGGGANNGGTLFSVTTTGKEKVLHGFGGVSDGSNPSAGLINVNGTLYGTTYNGGLGCAGSYGCGIVFKIATTGKEKVLHRFSGGSDGAHPQGSLIDVNGELYGTTTGGGSGCGSSGTGCGTVFGITTDGKEKVLYSFFSNGSEDGFSPTAGLINVKGTLYGTTEVGGTHYVGTLFSVTLTGREKVLYSFSGAVTDGADPLAGLIDVNGTLYGTTSSGGSYKSCGTVFAFSLHRQLHSLTFMTQSTPLVRFRCDV